MNSLRPTQAEIEELIDDLLLSYQSQPVDLLNINDGDAEYRYLTNLRPTYIRTVNDIISHLRGRDPRSVKILEIGCYLGVLCIALARLGYRTSTTDIPEFIRSTRLRKKLEDAGVQYKACNLRDYALPFAGEEFDVVIMCEVLEHLNFNPLPIVKEINRVIKPQGIAYIALPNLAEDTNRWRLLNGQSVHNPINDYFAQLDPNDNMIVGLHWREYTAAEVKEMLERMNFRVTEQKYVSFNRRRLHLT